MVADRLLAVVVFAMSVVELFLGDVIADRRLLALAGIVAVSVPLAWRRLRPLVCEVMVLAGLVGLNAAGVRIDELVGPTAGVLICIYSAAEYEHRRRAVVAALVAYLAVGISVFTVSNQLGDYAFAAVLVSFAWVTGRLVRARLLQVARLAEAAVRLELEQVERERAAVTEERARIARELHDVIAHGVTAIVIQAGAAQALTPPAAVAAHEALEAIQAIGRNTQTELVRLLGLLREDHAEIGLAPQPGLSDIGSLVELVRSSGVPIELYQDGVPSTISQGLALTAYRIVQEALTNVQRHAGGAPTFVGVRCCSGSLEIEVVNASTNVTSSDIVGARNGLIGMRERAALYGGTVEAARLSDGGFRVRARLPLDGAER